MASSRRQIIRRHHRELVFGAVMSLLLIRWVGAVGVVMAGMSFVLAIMKWRREGEV